MSTSSGEELLLSPEEEQRRRRIGRIVATILLAVATTSVACVALVDSMFADDTQLLIGQISSGNIVPIATLIGFIVIGYMLCIAPVAIVARVLLILVGIVSWLAGLLALAATLFTAFPFTTLQVGECDSGYIVEERSFLYLSAIIIYEHKGLLITPVERTGADDGDAPFAAGAYRARIVDDQVDVRFEHRHASGQIGYFTLPVLAGTGCEG